MIGTRSSEHTTCNVRDYRTVRSKPGYFLYLDPPYKLQKCRLYLGKFDHEQFFEWLGKQQRSGDTLSLNGFIGEEDRRVEVPDHRYDEELKIDNGISTISRLSGMPAPRLQNGLYLRLR